jgi:phosphohistidine phosphatase
MPVGGATASHPRRVMRADPISNAAGHAIDLSAHKRESVAMHRLMLLRHAKSDWSSSSGTPDMVRPLNARGEAAARLMGGYMARHRLIPQRVLCSPAQRTRETWAGISAQWGDDVEVAFEELLYAATPQAILSVIKAQGDARDEAKAAVRILLVIGHNPGLQEAAELLIAAGDVSLRERLREKFPTSALAVIDFAADRWNRIHNRSGRLDRYVTPRSIAAETN